MGCSLRGLLDVSGGQGDVCRSGYISFFRWLHAAARVKGGNTREPSRKGAAVVAQAKAAHRLSSVLSGLIGVYLLFGSCYSNYYDKKHAAEYSFVSWILSPQRSLVVAAAWPYYMFNGRREAQVPARVPLVLEAFMDSVDPDSDVTFLMGRARQLYGTDGPATAVAATVSGLAMLDR